MIKSVIFDLDGTLLDTSEGVISSVEKMIDHYGFRKLSREELETFIGPPISKSVIRHYGLDDEKALEAMKYFRKEYISENPGGEKADLFKGSVYPGMEILLQDLRNLGIRVGVATYKQENQAIALLEDKDIAKYFDVIHGADPEGKLTKADVVALSIKELGHTPEETVMVGDSDNDAIGAEGADALFIGVTYGFGFKKPEDVEEFQNIGISPTTEGVLEIVNNYNK